MIIMLITIIIILIRVECFSNECEFRSFLCLCSCERVSYDVFSLCLDSLSLLSSSVHLISFLILSSDQHFVVRLVEHTRLWFPEILSMPRCLLLYTVSHVLIIVVLVSLVTLFSELCIFDSVAEDVLCFVSALHMNIYLS